ncbi:MAG: hypothetical protein LBT40_15055 [Deltaproteobacteria bacterium]|jgi:pentatricopeptide repeat protein|nr:hypothetical protein [Deltaproteobacteria bacterium]
MAFPGIEELLNQGRFGAAEELILAFSADCEGDDTLLLAGHLADLAGEYSRLGRAEDAARARDILLDLEGEGLELHQARAGVSLMNAWIDQGDSGEAMEVFRGMPGDPMGASPHPDRELERLVMVAYVNLLSALADARDLGRAESLFGSMRARGASPENSDLLALAALNAVILLVHADRKAEAQALALEMEGYGDGEETRRYCASARKIVSGMGGEGA